MRSSQWYSSSSKKAKHFWLSMDVVGENEALQQFFEGKSLVVREGLSNFWWQQKKYSHCWGLVEERRKKKSPETQSSVYTSPWRKAVPE